MLWPRKTQWIECEKVGKVWTSHEDKPHREKKTANSWCNLENINEGERDDELK